jgi:heme/copper-type cytochrome/quinol oxidase subunit 4
MIAPNDLRASERIPIRHRVQVQTIGRMTSYALALNISMGGLFLSAATALPVGSSCRLEIPIPGRTAGEGIITDGIVIRSNDMGSAIKFDRVLDDSLFQELINQAKIQNHPSFYASYINYFKAGQSDNPSDCERLLGVSKNTYNKVFIVTFSSCVALAILPVWLFQSSIPPLPAWVKITTSFGYGLIWLGIIQPTIDLTVFKFIRNGKSSV